LALSIVCCTIEAQCVGSWLGLRPHLKMKHNQLLKLAAIVQQTVDGSPGDDVMSLNCNLKVLPFGSVRVLLCGMW